MQCGYLYTRDHISETSSSAYLVRVFFCLTIKIFNRSTLHAQSSIQYKTQTLLLSNKILIGM